MFLENITDSENFQLCVDLEIIAGDFDIEPEKLKEILEYCIHLNLFQFDGENNILRCFNLEKRFDTLLSKRKRQRNGVIDDDNIQSKVKESKVNNTLTGIKENSPEFLVLEFLKKEIWVNDFREEDNTQKIKAQEIYDLKQKVWEPEFRRRLEAIKADRLKLQNCNSISYLYGELKSARIDPIPPTPIAGNAGANTQTIPKMHTPLVNPYLADIEVERDPEESARVKAELDERVAKLKARGILSNRPNILTPHA